MNSRSFFLICGTVLLFFIALLIFLTGPFGCRRGNPCWIGAYLGDQVTAGDLGRFKADFGKKPYLVMLYVDWYHPPDEKIIREVYGAGSVLLVTWEPWDSQTGAVIDFEAVLSGRQDGLVRDFARRMKAIPGPVFLRPAHEMNGDWYPWAGSLIGPSTYIKFFRYLKDIFDGEGVRNVSWIFSVNWTDVPDKKENRFWRYYPGDAYVDYVGIDGYNWGRVRPEWGWLSFEKIFDRPCREAIWRFHKPLMITEFGSTGAGGDKARWIRDALTWIRKVPQVRAFILFDVNKEADWQVRPGSEEALVLRRELARADFSECGSVQEEQNKI